MLDRITLEYLQENFDLLLFDLDGTLVEKFTSNLLPGVEKFFRELNNAVTSQEGFTIPAFAICTNQGGVGLRYWMEERGFGEPEKYPTTKEFMRRFWDMCNKLMFFNDPTLYVCYRYKTADGEWSPCPYPRTSGGNLQGSRVLRKPNPGMLFQAMISFDALPDRTAMIGDSEEDIGAARVAGCTFIPAGYFFRGWE